MSVHIAGPYDDTTYEQRCVRCGALVTWPLVCAVELVEWNPVTQRHDLISKVQRSRGRRFPLGALVEITTRSRCMVLERDARATCATAQEGAA